MGRSVAERFASARDVFARADAALGESSPGQEPISKLCFEGPDEALVMTANTQPALVATSSAIVAAIREAHPALSTPVVALGHSLGEYSALVASGALSLEDAVRLCRARGKAMQAAVPPGEGSMAAVIGVDDAAIQAACTEASSVGPVSPANFNAPGQTVIAGAAAAVARATEMIGSRGGKVIPLKVSAPFHCALMKPAAVAIESELAPVTVGELAFPVIANVDAEPNQDKARVKGLLVKQVDSPVEWVRSIKRASEMKIDVALEIGPGKVLAGLVKRIDKSIRVVSVSDAKAVEELSSILG
jgi:[acyl-carrier-protein] S-malonyltransferase